MGVETRRLNQAGFIAWQGNNCFVGESLIGAEVAVEEAATIEPREVTRLLSLMVGGQAVFMALEKDAEKVRIGIPRCSWHSLARRR